MKTLEPESKPKGLACRQCGCRHFYTVYTRVCEGGIIRLKQCRHCGTRIHTQEKML